MWSDGTVGEGPRPGWLAEWLEQRRDRVERARERTAARVKDPKTAERRERRVDDGLAELDQCFFFQAEDGIRDLYVTGVQTCALPISRRTRVGSTSRWSRSCTTR